MSPDGLLADPADADTPDWLLWEDGPLIAVNKPAGLLTEGTPAGEFTMVDGVKAWLRKKYRKHGNVYLGIPHRLDRATSGVLVFTRNSKTAARVAEQFRERRVCKIYWALLEKRPANGSGLLVDWLRKNSNDARSEVVASNTDGAREARLEYRVLGMARSACLVEVELLTGRMHQIRVQFASRDCPIVGDTKYGAAPWQTAPSQDTEGVTHRIALHARSLRLMHPIRYDEVLAEARVPGYWKLDENAYTDSAE